MGCIGQNNSGEITIWSSSREVSCCENIRSWLLKRSESLSFGGRKEWSDGERWVYLNLNSLVEDGHELKLCANSGGGKSTG